MEQVAAKQRIKVATKDHILISRLHLKLHPEHMFVMFVRGVILLFVALAIFIAVGIAQPDVKSEWKVTGLGELEKR